MRSVQWQYDRGEDLSITEAILSFDKAYDTCSKSLVYDKNDAAVLADNKMAVIEFLNVAAIDCYAPFPVYRYAELIVDEHQDFFKTKHSKNDFIRLIDDLTRKLSH